MNHHGFSPPYGNNNNNNNDDIDVAFVKRGCCLCINFFDNEPSHNNNNNNNINNNNGGWQRFQSQDTTVFGRDSSSSSSWWERGWNKVKDWSEEVVVPQWRMFLRRFDSKKRGGDCVYNYQYGKLGKFQYDPKSYARNFDEGPNQNGYFDEDLLGRVFSSRFSLPPGSAHSSLDFDKEGSTFKDLEKSIFFLDGPYDLRD